MLRKMDAKGGENIPTFACKDVGMECGFKAIAPTEKDLMPKIAEHASTVHNMKTIDSAMMTRVKAAIKK